MEIVFAKLQPWYIIVLWRSLILILSYILWLNISDHFVRVSPSVYSTFGIFIVTLLNNFIFFIPVICFVFPLHLNSLFVIFEALMFGRILFVMDSRYEWLVITERVSIEILWRSERYFFSDVLDIKSNSRIHRTILEFVRFQLRKAVVINGIS